MQGRSNTILFPLAVLGLLALLTLWIDRTVQAPEPRVDGNTRHDPDYILNNFVTTKTDPSGNISHILKASEMRHYPDDDTTELENPHFTQYGAGKPPTTIEGKRGQVSSNGEVVQFRDDVRVVRAAFADKPEMTLTTDYLQVEPQKEIATTNRPVVITQGPKSVVRAVGMIYDKKQQTIQLNKRVRTHYESPNAGKKVSKPKTAKPAPNKATTTKPAAKNTSNKQTKSGTAKNAKLPTKSK
ncbi:LPS export ABC transporter periplasmic protein LptC [Methylobacillus gramineus]|uniref:LPS export ABC transporter periplasmic protein LptC n=1 Tax=Methylobacillus gramineus TaxID=755169 RepID=UPI001CFFDCD9|nr:LPS export ABC transporter periplasmic protein LptC [Methylobacillus gramineus]MCB5185572.1 LPS export ABC transporter periplasmic protein LptC [Methylobacillus gramineus]